MIINTIKNLSTLSKVLLGTTAVLTTATTVAAVKDYKASKAEEPIEDENEGTTETEADEAKAE